MNLERPISHENLNYSRIDTHTLLSSFVILIVAYHSYRVVMMMSRNQRASMRAVLLL